MGTGTGSATATVTVSVSMTGDGIRDCLGLVWGLLGLGTPFLSLSPP